MNNINANFWLGKRVLLTGHTGFKGSWLCLWLHSMGAIIRGIALNPPTEPSLFNILKLQENVDHCVIDIRNYKDLLIHFQNFRPEIVFHLAAQPLVRTSYMNPIETFETNVMGTVHVLEASRQTKSVKAVVNVTTDKCYENREWVWGYRESDPMGGFDPYSCSKGCAELVSSAYRNSYYFQADIALATARAGNVIGGGDWAIDRLVPDVLTAFEQNNTVTIRNPNSIRPWQHVLEPLSGYIILAQYLFLNGQSEAEGWNFGPNDEDARPVKWIIEYMEKLWNHSSTWRIQPGEHPHEASYLKLDISKARQRLNWQPRWSLETALIKTIDWHKAWLNNEDMKVFSKNQILEYIS